MKKVFVWCDLCYSADKKKKKSWTEGQFEANSKQRSADWYRFTAGFAEPYRSLNKLLVLNGYFEKEICCVSPTTTSMYKHQ